MRDALIAYANLAGDRWASWVVAASMDAALLLAMVALAWCVLRKRVAPEVGYCLFLLVPLKLLVPVVVTVPAALARWTPSGLMSTWLEGTQAPGRVRGRSPAETRLAEARTDRPARPETPSLPVSRSEPVEADAYPSAFVTARRPSGPIARAASAPAGPVGETPALSRSATVMVAWLIGVIVLSGRLAVSQLRFRARLRQARPLDDPGLGVDLGELRRCAGVRRAIRVMEHDSIASPSVWGIVRPTIILPRGLAASLTPRQLRWVMLHELAHVRRGDLIVLTLQRIAAILHFYNPAIWVANRVVHQLREYACDDLALALGHSSAVESGEAFVRVLRTADRGRRGLEGALGVFGLDSRASCFLRIRRLLDTERPIRTAPGAWTLGALVLVAAVALPHLRAAGDDAPAGSRDQAQGPATPNRPEPKAADAGQVPFGEPFDLRVVGPGGISIPGALVELRTTPAPAAEQIRQGTFVRKALYGSFVTADAEGRVLVTFPLTTTRLNVNITIPGYGPYWAGWSSEKPDQTIPPLLIAELEAGWSVGGVVVDAEGKPVEGTTIRPYIKYKRPPGDLQEMYIGAEIKSDAAGRWRFDSVPDSMGEVTVEIHHTDFQPAHRPLKRGEFGIERGREPSGRIALDRGLTVTGKVTDEEGRPIAGALVRTKFLNDVREARTGNDGAYRLVGCEPKSARIVVSAPGRATDMKELSLDPKTGPVDFRMKPGGTVRIRVTDEQGHPLPRAVIFFQQWRGPFYSYFEFGHVSKYADADGTWVWHEAPLDEFRADICPPGHEQMQLLRQPMVAREEEYVFRLPPALVISGKVIDAETREPVREFRVIPGVKFSETNLHWARGDGFPATGGQYLLRRDRADLAHLVRIEADGYQAANSREIQSTEGSVSIDFELKKGRNIAAKVVTPGLRPAAGARVALGVAGSQINVKNGEIDDLSTFSAREVSDADGRFHFPGQDGDFQLVITHPSGYAQIRSPAEWDTVKIIRLEPWARAEGTFRVGPRPAANVPIELDIWGRDSFGEDGPRIHSQHYASTGPDGRFVFDRVIPGRGWIGRRVILMADTGATEVTSSCTIAADFPAGKTAKLDLGGTGRAVVGKLQPAEGFVGDVRWNLARVTAGPDAPEARVAGPHLTATVDREGGFRIDDVPAGEYSLNVHFQRDDAGQLRNHRFQVPPGQGDAAGPPIDLGTLKLGAPGAR